MNIVRSHNYHVRNFSICDPALLAEAFDDPDNDFQSISDLSIEYRCQECRDIHRDADILAMETYKLSRACRKYKSKLEIIRENISSIIMENELSDDEHGKIEKIPVFNPALSVIYGELADISPEDDPESPEDDPEDFGTMPELKYIEN